MAVMVPTVPVTMAMPTVVPPMVPAMMPMMMPMPTHLGGRQLRILLHRCSSARIDQRHRLRTSDRSCHDEKRADSRQAQNFRSVHSSSPSQGISRQRRAVAPVATAATRRRKESREGDVNVD
jgi:hypothetical protein